MKFLWLKSKIEIKDKLLLYYILSLLFFVLFIFINIKVIKYFEVEDYSRIIGLNSMKKQDILFTTLQLLSYIMVIYFSIKMYINGITKNIEYVMIRISKKRWIIYEMINCSIYVICMRTFLNIILCTCFIFFNANITINSIIVLYLKDIFFYLNLSLLIILALNLACLVSNLKLLSIIPLVIILITMQIDFTNSSVIYMIIFFMILTLTNIVIFSPSKIYNNYKK